MICPNMKTISEKGKADILKSIFRMVHDVIERSGELRISMTSKTLYHHFKEDPHSRCQTFSYERKTQENGQSEKLGSSLQRKYLR